MPPFEMLNVPPSQIVERELAVACAIGELGDPGSTSANERAIGVAQHGHHQPLPPRPRCRSRSALVDDVAADHLGVDAGEQLARRDARFDEERHEAELQPCCFSNRSLYARAESMNAVMSTSLNVVSDRRLVLRLDEPLGDALAQRRHRDDLVARIDVLQAISSSDGPLGGCRLPARAASRRSRARSRVRRA